MSDSDRSGDQFGLGLQFDEPPPPPRRRRRGGGRVGRAAILVGALVVVLGALGAVVMGGRSLLDRLDGSGPADYVGEGTGTTVVQVHPGDSLTRVGRALEAADVVRSVEAFTAAASGDRRATALQPGYYRLHHRMSGAAALALLLAPSSRVSSRVTVPEGATESHVLRLYDTRTPLDLAALRAAVRSPAATPLPPYAHGRAEGFLFPSTYDVDPGVSADGAISAMVAQFAKHADALGLTGGAQQLGMTPYQVVTVASILEKEAGVAADFPKVARVIYNRLAAGMPLQLDSTLNYVLAERKAHLTTADLRNPSAYNTYAHRGLPPTPIDNPGERALAAALHPAPGDWIYFITVDKAGHSAFTASYQEFLRLKAKAKRDGVIN
ncbi:MAG: endolytic transglycosylase MltG [Frankiaceae bacterium]